MGLKLYDPPLIGWAGIFEPLPWLKVCYFKDLSNEENKAWGKITLKKISGKTKTKKY